MAHKTGKGSSKNGRDSASKRLGLKKGHLGYVKKGNVLFRQSGLKVKPGYFVGVGSDNTLYALRDGFLFYNNTASTNKLSVVPL